MSMNMISAVVHSILASNADPVLPVLSINGTSKHVLYESYYDMLEKTDDLLRYMLMNGPNARDYGQQDMELFNKAITQYKMYMESIKEFRAYLEKILEHLA